MSVVHRFREFLLEEHFEISIKPGQVHLMNFTKIGHFDSNKIVIYHEGGWVEINGKSLVVSKLMQDEVLITGNIGKIEFR